MDRQSIEYLCHSKQNFVDGKLIFDAQKQAEKDEMVKNEKNRIIQKNVILRRCQKEIPNR